MTSAKMDRMQILNHLRALRIEHPRLALERGAVSGTTGGRGIGLKSHSAAHEEPVTAPRIRLSQMGGATDIVAQRLVAAPSHGSGRATILHWRYAELALEGPVESGLR